MGALVRRKGSPLRQARRLMRHALDRAVMSAVHGFVFVTDGVSRAQRGNARKELVFSRGKLSLWHVVKAEPFDFELGPHSMREERATSPTPVLLVPPLMVRPYVFDLRPDHSMVRTLRNAGFDVYIVDFGVPDDGDEGVRLDDYVLDYMPACIDAAIAHSQQPQVTLAGYCMGGLFSLLHVATHHDARVKNLVTIGAPIDFTELGVVSLAAKLGARFADPVMDRIGNVSSEMINVGFKLIGGPKMLTRYVDLVTNLWDYEYLRSFDSINQWTSDFIPYPKEAFKQMVKDVAAGDKLRRGELTFGGKRADLKAIEQPLLAFAGRSDEIATLASTRAILEHVSSRDKDFREVPGGHIGVLAGSKAASAVWQPMVEWLRVRS